MASIKIFRAELKSPGVTGAQIKIFRSEILIPPVVGAAVRIFRSELKAPTGVSISSAPTASVEPFSTVTLVGAGGNSSPAVQQWTQVSGTAVTLTVVSPTTVTLKVPGDKASQSLIFRYNVDGATADVTVNVLAATETWKIGSTEYAVEMVWNL